MPASDTSDGKLDPLHDAPTTEPTPPEMVQEAYRSDKILPLERFLSEQPAFALSLAYLLIGLVGSFYYYQLFAEFKVNVFEFAEVSDFLLVVFRQPLIPALCIAFGLVAYILYRLHQFLRRRAHVYDAVARRWIVRDYGGRPYLIALIAAIPVLLNWIIPYCAHKVAMDIRLGRNRPVDVYLNAEASGRVAPWRTMYLIGATGRYVLFYDPEEGTQIIPSESITRISLPNEATGR